MQRKRNEPYLSSYFHGKGVRLGLPVAGNFELTARCNFDCPMCYVHLKEKDAEAKEKELTAKEWLAIAEEAKNMGMIFVLLTGGEPFIRKDFFEIYRGMKAMGLYISINTNGSLLDGEIFERLLEDPPYRLNISLYGGANETYERMCGIPAYDRVYKNIKRLKEAGVDVTLNVSITPYNCGDIKKIYQAAKKLGTPMKAASYMYPPVRIHQEQYGSGDRLSPEAAAACSVEYDRLRFSEEEFALRAQNMKKIVSMEPARTAESAEGERIRCRAGSTSFWITWDGKMLPCGMMPQPAFYPLEIGFAEAWKQIRSKTKEIRMPSKCSTCSHREVCAVCAAVCITETGAFDKVPEYVCQQTKEMVRLTQESQDVV